MMLFTVTLCTNDWKIVHVNGKCIRARSFRPTENVVGCCSLFFACMCLLCVCFGSRSFDRTTARALMHVYMTYFEQQRDVVVNWTQSERARTFITVCVAAVFVLKRRNILWKRVSVERSVNGFVVFLDLSPSLFLVAVLYHPIKTACLCAKYTHGHRYKHSARAPFNAIASDFYHWNILPFETFHHSKRRASFSSTFFYISFFFTRFFVIVYKRLLKLAIWFLWSKDFIESRKLVNLKANRVLLVWATHRGMSEFFVNQIESELLNWNCPLSMGHAYWPSLLVFYSVRENEKENLCRMVNRWMDRKNIYSVQRRCHLIQKRDRFTGFW